MLIRFFVLLLLCTNAQAISLPGIGQLDAAPAVVDQPSSNTDKAAQIELKLQSVQEQLQQLDNTENDPEAYTRRFMLEIQQTTYRQHLAALAGLQSQAGLNRYKAPNTAIASGVMALNAQQALIQATELEIENLTSILSSQEQARDELRDNNKQAQAQLRLKSEALEEAKPAQQKAALNEMKKAQLSAATQLAMLDAREERLNYIRAQLQNSRERLQALKEAMKNVPERPKVSSAEMSQIEQQAEERRQAINARIMPLLEEKKQLEQAAQQLDVQRNKLLQEKTEPSSDKVNRTQQEIDAELVDVFERERINFFRLDNNVIRTNILLDVLNSQSLEGVFWQIYFSIGKSVNSSQLAELHQQSKKWIATLQHTETEMHQAMIVALMQASLITPNSNSAKVEHDLWLERANAYRDAENEWSRLRLIISRRSAEFVSHNSEKTLEVRAHVWRDRLLTSLYEIWQYELFAVADTLNIDGKNVSINRGVTVGKVTYAILLITIGFFVILKLSGWFERRLVNRLQWSAVSVRIGKRWVLSVAFIILLINSLLLVRIPLTVFAFMGGAIAIGLGFGMQTLLKNLISGLMMILERPFKPGDTVAVGNLIGTVVDMSVRAAVIRDVNGIETLVPNSTFLEQNVTNWTYSSSLIRQNVKVGVAYGCDVRLVAKLLAEEADRHGQVCKEPKPEVLLEDFGADALMFGIYYWIDIAAGTIGRQVASDMRFMIEASLRKHNIAIAYPQRDVHLDITQPVTVNLQEGKNTQDGKQATTDTP